MDWNLLTGFERAAQELLVRLDRVLKSAMRALKALALVWRKLKSEEHDPVLWPRGDCTADVTEFGAPIRGPPRPNLGPGRLLTR